jgi:hypothetical protein
MDYKMEGIMRVKKTSVPAFVPIGEWSPERQEIENLKAELKDTQSRCFQEWMNGIMHEREVMYLKEELQKKNAHIARLMKKKK